MQQTHNGSPKSQGAEKKLRNLRPFKPGPDPRRCMTGRPKSFDQFREIAQSIAADKDKAEKILNDWANSSDVQKQKAFIEYAFGKVPDKLETTGLENKPVLLLHYAHERQANGQN